MIDLVSLAGKPEVYEYKGKHPISPGSRYGRWVIVALPVVFTGCILFSKALCRCDCGTESAITLQSLIGGRSTKCLGCSRKNRVRTHGLSRVDGKHTTIYTRWQCMKRRCLPTNKLTRANYFDRGITVCPEWEGDFPAFHAWATANGYRDDLTLDRINNDLGYFPENCRWVPTRTQSRNKRTNHVVTAFGESKPVVDWATDPRCKASLNALYLRIYHGWDAEAAITRPLSRGTRHVQR